MGLIQQKEREMNGIVRFGEEGLFQRAKKSFQGGLGFGERLMKVAHEVLK